MERHTLGQGTRWILAIGMILVARWGWAEETGRLDRLRIHGFASQALIHTTDNRWMGDSPEMSHDFSELGVNASLRLTPGLLFSSQILARRAGDMYDGAPALDYGLADITLASSPEHRLGVRIGRFKNPLGLYNETRDVPFTRPGVFLPQVVYFDKLRNAILSSDGIMAYGELYRDFGILSMNLANGWPIVDDNLEWVYLNSDFQGDIKLDKASWLGGIWYSCPTERLRLGLSGAALRLRFNPDEEAPFTLGAGTTDILYWLASFQYNAEKWTLSAEYAREPIKWRDYGPFFEDREATGEGWYLQGTYRIHPRLDLLLRWEQGVSDTADRDGTELEAASGGLISAHSGFSRILTAGLRWDINRHWMLRAEYAYNEGTFVLSPRENPSFSDDGEYWSLFSVQAAFRF